MRNNGWIRNKLVTEGKEEKEGEQEGGARLMMRSRTRKLMN